MSLDSKKIQYSKDLARIANSIEDGEELKALYQSHEPDFFKHIVVADRDSLDLLIASLQKIKQQFPKKEEYDYDRYVVIVNSEENPVVTVETAVKDDFATHLKNVFLDDFLLKKNTEYNNKLNDLNS